MCLPFHCYAHRHTRDMKLVLVNAVNERTAMASLPPSPPLFKKKVEVALLSELEFKHQVTTARGEGGRQGRGA